MNADIMIEDVKPARCRTISMDTEIDRDRFVQQQAAWECLKFFKQIPTTMVDFRRRFNEMDTDDVTLLKAFYNVKTDTELLTMICRFWNVRV